MSSTHRIHRFKSFKPFKSSALDCAFGFNDIGITEDFGEVMEKSQLELRLALLYAEFLSH